MKSIQSLHEQVWRELCARRGQLPHALLLSGQRGIGKLALARAFADALLCARPSSSAVACGSCPACNWLAQGNHPDLRLLQPAALAEGDAPEAKEGDETAGGKKASQQITIDQVRDLDDFLHVGTHRQGLRIILLNPAEAMNRATANALLKSLEEPLAGTLFMLVASETHRLLPTIRSRCQHVPIPQPARSLAVDWLRAAGLAEPDDWLALAGGSPLLALDLSRSSERLLLAAWLAEVAHGERIDPLVAAANVDKVVRAEKRPGALKHTVDWAQKWLLDLILASEGLSPRYFRAQAALLQRLAALSDSRRLLAFERKALQYKVQCEQPVNSRLFLEDFFLNYRTIFGAS